MTRDMAPALDDLARRFLERTADDLATLLAFVSGARPVTPEEVRFLVHRLAGAAGIFGYQDLSKAAARLDAALVDNPLLEREAMHPLIIEIEAALRRA